MARCCSALGEPVQDCGFAEPFSCRTGDQYVPIYPYMFVLPNGKIFQAGAENGCPFLFGQPVCDPSQARILDMSSTCTTNGCMWSPVGTAPTAGGSAAMYRPGKVLKSGGADRGPDGVYGTMDDFVSAQAHVIDMTATSPAWRSVPAMAFPRGEHTLVLLPDGNVLAVGGTIGASEPQNAVLAAELWNATTETWGTLASMSVPRMYHSTAVLLPDARVLAAGGNNYPSAQVFSPPYLSAGSRPTVSSAPTTVFYTQTFTVNTPDGATIQSAALVRAGAVTHAFDQNQRYVPVSFTTTTGGLSVTAPSDGNVAPPGYYMLFLVNANGAPSVAKFVQVRGCG